MLAAACAFRVVAEWLKASTRNSSRDLLSTLPEAHACPAGLKSLTTSVTAVCPQIIQKCPIYLVVLEQLQWLDFENQPCQII